MGKKKKQHYIPQFYLKYFLDQESLKNNDPFLWVFDKKTNRCFPKSPKNIGFITYYYSYEYDGKWIDEIENNFSEIEYEVAQVYKDINKSNAKFIDVDQRYLFSKFICFMYNRTPKAREHIRIISQNIIKSKFVEMINNEGGIEDFLKKHNKKWFPDDFLNSFNQMKIIPQKITYLDVMLQVTKSMIPHFSMRNWTFLTPKSKDIYFITTDHPVFPYDSHNNYEINVPGFIKTETDIYFPISPHICLLASYRFKEEIIKIENNDVVWVNQLLMGWASRYVFSCINNYNLLFNKSSK